jgi:hypothetical protein
LTKCPFLGGYGVGRSTNAADSQLVNLYLEFIDSGEGKEPAVFYMTPGLTQLVTVGAGPISAFSVMGNTLYVVSNGILYSVSPSLTVTSLGSVGGVGVLSIINNGTQLMTVNGTQAFLYGPTYAVQTITVNQGGSGYTAPTISFTGGGGSGGATATATLLGSIASVTVTNGGVFASTPTISFSGGAGSGAAAYATMSSTGSVTSIAVTSGGTGYSGSVTVTLVGGGGSGATATATVSGGVVTALNVTAGGSGYTTAPTVTITNATGSGAGGQPVLGFAISTIQVTNGGANYTSAPTVNVTGGGQTSAPTLTAVVSYAISAINVTAGGAYNSAPTVVITDATGTGATATANLSTTNLGNTISSVTLPFSFPYDLSYQDGFGLGIGINSNNVYQSNLLDLSTWNSLNFSQADSTPTYNVGIYEKQREQWIFKSDCIEVWVNVGASGFAFQRLQGVFIEYGCAAPFTIAKLGDDLIWLGQNSQGTGTVWLASNYTPQRISTHAIENAIKNAGALASASAYAYQDSGHQFYCLTLPNYGSGGITFCLDLTATKQTGKPQWHQRASGSPGNFTQHPGYKSIFWNREGSGYSAVNVVCDNATNKLYFFDRTNATDNGTARSWLRSFRAVKEPSFQPRPFESLQLDMATGVSVSGSPTVNLSWSDDGGNTFSPTMSVSCGTTGQTSLPVKFNSLGSTTLQNGLDRIFQVSSTLTSSTNYQVALMGAEIMP